MKNQYNEDSIQVLEGLEAVRKRPGMYIGSTDSRGLHHMIAELLDNAIDEALAGHGTEINVVIHHDNSVTVSDQGRGIPIGMHKTGKPTPEVIFNTLHAGGKFGEGGYKVSGGLHGVGSSVVNALSEYMEVEIKNSGKIYTQTYRDGGKVITKPNTSKKTNQTGTSITFKPDDTIFSTTKFNYDSIAARMEESAYLVSGVTFKLKDKRLNREDVFYYADGIKAFINKINDNKKPIHEHPIYIKGEKNEIDIEMAFQYTGSYSEHVFSFVNNVKTGDGGTHEQGLKTAFTKTINEYARTKGLLKEKDSNFDGTDVREGLTAVISLKIPEKLLQFESQTKSKLGTPEAKPAVEQLVSEHLTFFLNENAAIAKEIISKITASNKAREAAKRAREDARLGKKVKKQKLNLSGKLSPAQKKDSKVNELFIVEGDSAGGSAKQGRDSKFQAILPLRGKVINAQKATLKALLGNEEISTIIHTLGAGFGEDFDLKDCNYDKVVLLTDADTDGAHIQVLLLTFFYRFMPKLVEAGKVYVAMPPLYKISKGAKKSANFDYAWDDEGLKKLVEKYKSGYVIQRYKGLGEMNADQLWDTTLNPETRSMIQITLEDANEADVCVRTLMGDNVEPRREWIEENVDFDTVDEFDISK